MATSFYDLSVACFAQTLTAVAGFLDRSRRHYIDIGRDPNDLTTCRLVEDMASLKFQVIAVAHYSVGAIRGIEGGVFEPPKASRPLEYRELEETIQRARKALELLDRKQIDDLANRDVLFQSGDVSLPFTADSFILSFCLPNLHFHATTAYDILRVNGAPIGKRDYMGRLRVKT